MKFKENVQKLIKD